MEEIRAEALRGLTILAMHDPEFRSGAIDDLEGTLGRYGYSLSSQEMEEVRNFHSRVANMSDEEILRDLGALTSTSESTIDFLASEPEVDFQR